VWVWVWVFVWVWVWAWVWVWVSVMSVSAVAAPLLLMQVTTVGFTCSPVNASRLKTGTRHKLLFKTG
jgi:hypothetical protein